ncbi:D-alanyl-D-alanine carboxypeptidase precursor [Nonomuraea coxensis DSM 45129]|uniref:D-alanyl-D-alanine carboxypeptidase n=1 Tax=Nonomuraea coxensis DSM 45129 TaxID=1122611 RepID=A0ABX8TWV3_9ACTN|nr:serine hydrolase domain-containing protein [Nonomuraea coxensis]QYC39975.1 D-alanyl-D-alanine carboxypeptidase precursor [Nonomuraea coxensis DSM 45129]
MTSRRFPTSAPRAALAAAMGALLAAGTLTGPAHAAGGPDRQALARTLDAVRDAGMYGIYSEVRDGGRTWAGASGVADVATGRRVRPDMVHRVGSITKTFVSVAILQQVARGTIELDAPVGRYLPGLVPGERGRTITVRMLLNHTSHIADYIAPAFPSLLEGSGKSLDDHRFRRIAPRELVRMGLAGTPTGEPGAAPGSYSNTNYVLAGLLLEKVTGNDAADHITRHVIRKAGLRHTSFPRSPHIPGPHSGAYESLYGLFDPPRDFGVYDMSWAGTAGAITSTMDDLNRFYRALLRGELLAPAQLAEMRRTVPVLAGGFPIDYGLGIYALDLPCGRFWGHDGGVFGMATQSLSSEDGERQLSFGVNRTKYQQIENGAVVPHAIDFAQVEHLLVALCGADAPTARTAAGTPFLPFPADRGAPVRP